MTFTILYKRVPLTEVGQVCFPPNHQTSLSRLNFLTWAKIDHCLQASLSAPPPPHPHPHFPTPAVVSSYAQRFWARLSRVWPRSSRKNPRSSRKSFLLSILTFVMSVYNSDELTRWPDRLTGFYHLNRHTIQVLLDGSSFLPNYIVKSKLKALCNSLTVNKFTCGYLYLKF